MRLFWLANTTGFLIVSSVTTLQKHKYYYLRKGKNKNLVDKGIIGFLFMHNQQHLKYKQFLVIIH